ncbi:MAG: ParB-like protein [Synechococcus sp.]|nr:ParB-like protein [Synechococcus sp.]
MSLHLPPYEPLPAPPADERELLEVQVAALQPTQLCVGLAEVSNRIADFQGDSAKERRRYLLRKPVPLVRSASGALWMVDRHHRLRGLLEVDPQATAFGYVVLDVPLDSPTAVLQALGQRGWLYLYDGRGLGPLHPSSLPPNLLGCQDDPFRSLVWKLKREGVIEAAPLIPFHEFRWGAWLRRKALPPFNSQRLEPALPAARAYARSAAASRLAGWKG